MRLQFIERFLVLLVVFRSNVSFRVLFYQSQCWKLAARIDSLDFTIQRQWVRVRVSEACRIDEFLYIQAPDLFPSLTAAKKTVRRGLVTINKKEAETTNNVYENDTVTSYVRSRVPVAIQRPVSDVTINILYEDGYLAVVDKPRGMPVFSGENLQQPPHIESSSSSLPLYSHLLMQLNPTNESQPLTRPQPVHRLDTETGGLILVAKTRPALQSLSRLFSSRVIKKTYHAVVANTFTSSEELTGSIMTPLGNQSARTDFEHLRSFLPSSPCPHSYETLGLSLMRLSLHTGRTHQIRRHLDMIGHPVLYDKSYWNSDGRRGNGGVAASDAICAKCGVEEHMQQSRQFHFLWSTGMQFIHPITNLPVSIILSMPPAITALFVDYK